MTPGPCAGCQSRGQPYHPPNTVTFERLPPLALSSLSSSSSSSVLLLLVLPLIVIIVDVVGPHGGIPRERVAPPSGAWMAPIRSTGGDNRSPGRQSAGSSCARPGSPPHHRLLHHHCSCHFFIFCNVASQSYHQVMSCRWNLFLHLDLVAIWQKNASGLPVANFCQINATQYKTHKFLRGHVQWLATGKYCQWQATVQPLAEFVAKFRILLLNIGFCCHLRILLPLAKIQCKCRVHTDPPLKALSIGRK
jgi:hypothetical protein